MLKFNPFYNRVYLQKYQVIDMVKTGENISRMIKKTHFSDQVVKFYLGLDSVDIINDWRNGKALPSIDIMPKLAVMFKTTIDKIIIINGYSRKHSH